MYNTYTCTRKLIMYETGALNLTAIHIANGSLSSSIQIVRSNAVGAAVRRAFLKLWIGGGGPMGREGGGWGWRRERFGTIGRL